MDDVRTAALQPDLSLMSSAPDIETLDQAEKGYLTYRARKGGVIHVEADAAHLPYELEKKWFPEEPKWQGPAAKLRKHILDYVLPISEHVHPGAMLRLDIHLTKDPPHTAPRSPNTIVARASLDAAKGLAHHRIGRAGDLKDDFAGDSVPLGLTLLGYSIEQAGDPLTVDLEQGGNPFRRETLEMQQDAEWRAERNKSEGLGTPPFIGPGWPLPPLEGQKAMGIGAAAVGALLGTRQQFGNQRANEPMLPHVHFAEAHATTEAQNNQKFFEQRREDEHRRTDAEFWKKKNETDKRMQEDARKNAEATAALAQSQVLEADLARLRSSPASMRDPALLAAVRGDEAKLAGMPGATPRTQIDIQTTNLDLADAAQDALKQGREVSMKAAEQTAKDSAEAAGVNAKKSTEAAAAQSATVFVAPAIGAVAVQTSFDEPEIAQGSVDYTGHIEPVNGPEDPGGGQAREGVPPIMQGSVDFQGRVQPVAGALRSEEIDNVAGSTNVEGEVEPVRGEQGVRAEEPDVDNESGIADSGEPLPNVPARPQAAETAAETDEEVATTKYAEQAQAIVEQEQARGIAPAPPAEAAVAGDVQRQAVEQNVAREAVGSAVEQNVGGGPDAATGATSEALHQPEQSAERQAEPAAAPAERVQEGANRVENVIGEPAETISGQSETGRRGDGGEGAGVLATEATARGAVAPEQSQPPTGMAAEPASAPVDRVLERADEVGGVVGEPVRTAAEVPAEEAIPAGEPVREREGGGEGAGAVAAGAPVRDAASSQEPQQPTQIETAPAFAAADQTLERADAVRNVIGEPLETGGAATAQEFRPETAEVETSAASSQNEGREIRENQSTGTGDAVAATAANAGTVPVGTGAVAPSGAEAQSAGVVTQQAVQPESVVGQPQQNDVRDRRDAASLPGPEQESSIETPPASETAGQVMHHAEAASHLVPEAASLSSSTAAAQNQATVGVTENVPPPTQAVTPEQEITGQTAPTANAEAAQAIQPRAAQGQTPPEVVTVSPETGEVVSQPANAGEKTFADVAAETPPPTSDAATAQNAVNATGENQAAGVQGVRPDQAGLTPSETDREMAERTQQQQEEVGDLGLGTQGAHNRVVEHMAAAAFAAPAATPVAAAAAAAQHATATVTATPPPTNANGLAGPAIDRSRGAPSATDLSQQAGSATGRKATAATAAAGANASQNAGLNGKAGLGQHPLPPQAEHIASNHYAPLEKQPAARTGARQPQTAKQKPARVKKLVAKTAPASFDAIRPVARRKAAAAVAPAKAKGAAAVRQPPPKAKATVAAQPRGKPAPAMRKASVQKRTVASGGPDSRRQKRQIQQAKAMQRRVRTPVDIEPGPE